MTTILDTLAAFAGQRPGLDPRNYISGWNDTEGRRAYFSEARSITRDLHDVRELAGLVARNHIGEDHLRAGFRAFSGRLTLNADGSLDYCTGQYWPTEYRKAVAAVLAAAVWSYFRADCCCDTGDKIRKAARRNLSRGVAARWFA